MFSWLPRTLLLPLSPSPEDGLQPAGYHGLLCGEALREEAGLPAGYQGGFCGEALREEAGLQPRVSLVWRPRGVMCTSDGVLSGSGRVPVAPLPLALELTPRSDFLGGAGGLFRRRNPPRLYGLGDIGEGGVAYIFPSPCSRFMTNILHQKLLKSTTAGRDILRHRLETLFSASCKIYEYKGLAR